MSCVQNSESELIYEFGPHGSTFDPPAAIYFHYKGCNPRLYYIAEDGSYVAQQPDDIDTMHQWLIIRVHHFSRYAVAWGE